MNSPDTQSHLSDSINLKGLDRKIWWHIIPFVVLLYIISILDRVNIGYAALTMNADLGIDPYLFGIVSGVFFLSYVLFEIPSNQILARTGARIWLCRIMVSWGIIAILMAFVRTPLELGALRFLLGAAEAGFAPGLILYLSFWFRKEQIAKALAVFFLAIPLAMVIAAPLSTFILSHVWSGITGWRWLFFIEGLPAIILGCAILLVLPDKPEKASWLTGKEREWLTGRIEGDRVSKETPKKIPFSTLAKVPGLALLCISAFLVGLFLTGLLFWIPQIINRSGLSHSLSDTGYLVMVPYIFSVMAMYAWSQRSDRLGERRLHIAIPFIAAALFLMLLAIPSGPILMFIFISAAIIACYCAYAPFFALTVESFTPGLRASGIALVNTVASIGSFFGPVLFGLAGGNMGGILTTLLFPALGVCLICCAVLIRKK